MERRNFIGRSAKNGKQKSTSVYRSTHIPGAKHFKIKQDGQAYIFSALTPKQFKENGGGRVVGRFGVGKKNLALRSDKQFEIQKGQSGRVDFNVYNAHQKFTRAAAYVPIGNDEFLIYEKSILPVAVGSAAGVGAVVAGLAVAGFLGLADGRPVNPLGIATGVTIGGENGQEDIGNEMIDFAGYDDVTVTASEPYMYLQNPESNDVYFSYVISDTSGTEYVTTDLIPPGKALQWNAKSALGSGAHTINMHVDTYDMNDTAIPYNAMNYDSVKVTVQ